MTGGALVVQADARCIPLPDASVDLIITSPPFWNLRDYGVAGQIGNEPTREEFLEQLWEVTRECMRVMKPTASLFVELGDSYSTRYSSQRGGGRAGLNGDDDSRGRSGQNRTGSPEKSLNLAPQRYVIGCVDQLGLILRAEIIWSRPNGLPESVKDRVRLSHSRWWHLTKQPRYYSAVDEVREPHSAASMARYQYSDPTPGKSWHDHQHDAQRGQDPRNPLGNPLGKLPGSVWTIPSEPLRLPGWLGVDHYAAFPSEWPRRLILGWSPPGICLDCGQGRVPVVDRGELERGGHNTGDGHRGRWTADDRHDTRQGSTLGYVREATILGYGCACTPHTDHAGSGGGGWGSYDDAGLSGAPAANGKQHVPGNYKPKVGPWREYHLDDWRPPPTRPSVVLDPFSGTGTTIGVARQLGRIGIGVDLSHAYCRAARYRVFQSGDFGKAEARTWADRQGALL